MSNNEEKVGISFLRVDGVGSKESADAAADADCMRPTCKRREIEMRAELERLRADGEMLDWLADPNNSIGNVQLPSVCIMNNVSDMRAAISEAMRLDPQIAADIATQTGES